MAAAALCSDYVLGYDVILPPDRSTILYVDTEQSCGDCQLLMRRILALAGHSPDVDSPKLVFLSLRQYTPAERVAIIEEAMASLPTVGFVIIDGVRDLLHDINNPTEATSVISLLMKWTDWYQFHLHTVLHQNKSDDNARGHLGTELANKAETVMSIEKDKEDGTVSVVRPVYTRSAEFPPFAFRIGGGELALPEIVGDNAVSKITQFLRNKRMIVQDDNRKGAPYRFNPDFVW